MAQRVEHNPMEAAMSALVSHGLGGFNFGCPGLEPVVCPNFRISFFADS